MKYLLIFLLLAILGVLLGAGYQYFFAKIRIAKTPIVANETALREYLAMGPGRGITSLDIIQQNFWKETDDCISPARDQERIFCFEDSLDKGKLKIFIYPNLEALASTEPQVADRLLNSSLFLILENRFQINPEANNLPINGVNANLIFKW